MGLKSMKSNDNTFYLICIAMMEQFQTVYDLTTLTS